MKILVTGASGLLGRTVAETLLRDSHDVTVLQRRPSGLDCREVRGDLRDQAILDAAVEDQDAIIHLAARVSPTGGWQDFVVITPDNPGTLDDQRFYGAPDLVVEIISPSSVRQDNFKKFAEYEQCGVKEYWVIDPRRHYQTTHLYQLNEDREFDAVSPDEDGRLYSTVLPDFWLQNEWLWQNELPEPQLKLAEIMLTIPTLSDNLKIMYQMIYDTLLAES